MKKSQKNILIFLFIAVFLCLIYPAYAKSAEEIAKEYYIKAAEYASRGDFKNAEINFKKAYEINDDLMQAQNSLHILEEVKNNKIKKETVMHLYKGALCQYKGKLDEAIAEYKKALVVEPDNFYAKIALDMAETQKEGPSADNKKFSAQLKAVAENPDSAKARSSLGCAYLNEGKTDMALVEFKKSLGLDPDSPYLYDYIARIYYKNGRVQNSIDMLKKLAAKFPPYYGGNAHFEIGMIYAYENMPDKAIDEFRKGYLVYPSAHYNRYDSAIKLNNVIYKYKEIIAKNPSDARSRYILGMAYLFDGKSDNAVSEFKKTASTDPAFADAYFALAKTAQDYKYYAEAVRHGYKVHPKLLNDFADKISGQYYETGLKYISKNDLKQAKLNFKKAREFYKKNNDAKNALIIINDAEAGKISREQAIYLFKCIECKVEYFLYPMNDNPNDKSKHPMINNDKKIAMFKRFISNNPDYAPARYFLADAYYSAGQLNGDENMINNAVAELKKAVSIDPSFGDAYYQLGRIYSDKKMTDAAGKEFKKAFSAGYNDVDISYNSAMAYFTKGDLDSAIIKFKESIAADPDCEEAHRQLAKAYFKKGLTDEAIAEYKKAIFLNTENPADYCGLADAYFKKGMLNEAITEYHNAIYRSPAYAEAYNGLLRAYCVKKKYNLAAEYYNEAVRYKCKISPDLSEKLKPYIHK